MVQGARAATLAAAMTIIIASAARAQESCGFDLDDEALFAQGAPLEFLFGSDDRRVMNSTVYPWRAIGTLLTPGGSCTGTVVGRDLVLTAAHCVSEYVAGRIDVSDVVFLAGYRDGDAFAAAQATRIVPASNRPLEWDPTGDVSDDWALIELDQPIGLETGIIPVAELSASDLDLAAYYQTSIIQAGYSGDMPESLTGHDGCHLLAVDPGNWVYHDCDIVPGDSGSPLLMERDGQLQVFAVATAMLCSSDGVRAGNNAVDARAFGPAYRRMTDTGSAAVRIASPGQTNRSEERSGTGPRIVHIPCEGC